MYGKERLINTRIDRNHWLGARAKTKHDSIQNLIENLVSDLIFIASSGDAFE